MERCRPLLVNLYMYSKTECITDSRFPALAILYSVNNNRNLVDLIDQFEYLRCAINIYRIFHYVIVEPHTLKEDCFSSAQPLIGPM